MGPLITGEHRDKVRRLHRRRRGEGATLVVDGRQDAPGGGFFLKPSLIDNAKPGMACYDDEIFGPVLTVTRIGGYQEGLQLINDNPYGNGTAIFTRDGGAARQFEFDVQVGMVGVNVPVPVPVSYYSFGGWKASLFGDTHMYGPDGISFYTQTKVVTSRWPDPSTSYRRPRLPPEPVRCTQPAARPARRRSAFVLRHGQGNPPLTYRLRIEPRPSPRLSRGGELQPVRQAGVRMRDGRSPGLGDRVEHRTPDSLTAPCARRRASLGSGAEWTSGSSCRQPHLRRGWSISPGGRRRTGSRTCGRSTRTSCGRSRT